MESSYIKIYRGLLSWEWYKDSKMVHLFIHLLCSANFTDGRFKGVEIKRGQLVTGLKSLAYNTGISIQSLRTCLERLKSTSEITIKSTSEYSIITICKYEYYQSFEKKSTHKSTNEITNHQQTINKPSTTIEEGKEEEEGKEYIYNFFKSLIDYGFDEKLSKEWMLVRKNKKATNTETAFNIFIKEVEKSGLDKNYIIEKCVSSSWKGFKADWIKDEMPKPKIMIR